jgi:hypothetical protein
MCHFVDLGSNINSWLIGILSVAAAIMFAYAGFKLLTSGGNQGALKSAKDMIFNVAIGFAIVLAGFLLVDTLMKVFLLPVGDENRSFGPWQTILCVAQPEFDPLPDFIPEVYAIAENVCNTDTGTCGRPPNAQGAAAQPLLTQGEINLVLANMTSNGDVNANVEAALNAVGITDPAQRANFRGLISVESSDCQNTVGPDTGKGRGKARGCAQILTATARGLDAQKENRFAGKSDAFVQATMRDDKAYNILLGAEYFRQGLEKYDGNIEYALARYNGGDSALTPSNSCPGQTWYQCDVNTGYQQTRDYVRKIDTIATGLLQQSGNPGVQ